MRVIRSIVGLSCPLLSVAVHQQWGGRWLFVPFFCCGVAAVFFALMDRDTQLLDAPTTLNIDR